MSEDTPNHEQRADPSFESLTPWYGDGADRTEQARKRREVVRQRGQCAKCRRVRKGRLTEYWYGRELGTDVGTGGCATTTKNPPRYAIHGHREVFICTKCAIKGFVSLILAGLAMGAALCAPIALSLYVYSTYDYAQLPRLVGVLVVLLYVVSLLATTLLAPLMFLVLLLLAVMPFVVFQGPSEGVFRVAATSLHPRDASFTTKFFTRKQYEELEKSL